jgi:hypothetical protein
VPGGELRRTQQISPVSKRFVNRTIMFIIKAAMYHNHIKKPNGISNDGWNIYVFDFYTWIESD